MPSAIVGLDVARGRWKVVSSSQRLATATMNLPEGQLLQSYYSKSQKPHVYAVPQPVGFAVNYAMRTLCTTLSET